MSDKYLFSISLYLSTSLLGANLAQAQDFNQSNNFISNVDFGISDIGKLSSAQLFPEINTKEAYKTAAVCFLGEGNCAGISFGKGDDTYEIDTIQQCQNEGYITTSCTKPSYPFNSCPYNNEYYKGCKEDTDKACKESGYVNSCGEGYVKDEGQICPYDSSYYKCKCNPCDGYTYSYAEATADGYVEDDSCNSCGTMKYRRKENPCTGYLTCECGGEIGTPTCKSGSVIKYQTCKSCCENRCTEATCPDGYICEKEACSNKYCITGCAINYTNWCAQPTTNCVTLGYFKTADQCPDGYLKCPYGETVFCPTETKCAIGDIYYSDKTCTSADNYNSSKTALGVVVYITDGGKHGQIMAPWPIDENGNKTSIYGKDMAWGGYGTDISTLPNYTSKSSAATDYDSCGNTDKIVAAGSASIYPAAWATRRYAPTSETAGKWCLPATGIMNNIYKNQIIIQNTLSKFSMVFPTCCTWSSSEFSTDVAWVSNFGTTYGFNSGSKTSLTNVRPVMEFQEGEER